MNEVGFGFTAFRTVRGTFTIEASFEPVSPQRVAIRFSKATLVPEQLQKVFQVGTWTGAHLMCAVYFILLAVSA